jgi:parallel beta-helix repeat protein
MPCIVKAQTNVVSDITINTVWDISGSPYIIMNSISVQDGVSLSIDPGVEIKFNGLYSLSVLGEISAIGTLADSIIMTSNLENPNPLDWDRILVQGVGSNNSEFKYCRVEFGRVGISFENSSAKISNCLIKRCDRSGISIDGGSPTIINNTIHNLQEPL